MRLLLDAQLKQLYDAINNCDSMTLAEERRNDVERGCVGYNFDRIRLEHYAERRKAIREHRAALHALYVSIAGNDPWADVPL